MLLVLDWRSVDTARVEWVPTQVLVALVALVAWAQGWV
jgi:hypothetical protein